MASKCCIGFCYPLNAVIFFSLPPLHHLLFPSHVVNEKQAFKMPKNSHKSEMKGYCEFELWCCDSRSDRRSVHTSIEECQKRQIMDCNKALVNFLSAISLWLFLFCLSKSYSTLYSSLIFILCCTFLPLFLHQYTTGKRGNGNRMSQRGQLWHWWAEY